MRIACFNRYFVTAGRQNEALALRRRACETRERLGLVPGTVLVPLAKRPGAPDFAWLAMHESPRMLTLELRAQRRNPQLLQIYREQAANLRRLERSVWRLDGGRVTLDLFTLQLIVDEEDCSCVLSGRTVQVY